jgi:cytochrome bd ubiquinol oxidase subunit I
MDSAFLIHRLQFGFTVTYHYLFPQLTMGLALLIVILKTSALITKDEHFDRAARFWAKIFAINFAMGVVTGIPMEFQFGTNWSRFSKMASPMIGQFLAMEGLYAFVLESSFLGLFLLGEKKLSRFWHWATAVVLMAGSWLSGYFIIITDAWMQHPVGFTTTPDGQIHMTSFFAAFFNEWALWQYAHNMIGSCVTAAFVMASIGAFYLLSGKHVEYGKTFLRLGVVVGFIAAASAPFPTGDGQGKMLAQYQPTTLAGMEGLFKTEVGAPVVLIGQPDIEKQRLDNPIAVPHMLSFLTYKRWGAEVKGLNEFPKDTWPDNIPLLYYSFHIMAGLGTVFAATMTLAVFLLWRGLLFTTKAMLWVIMLMIPLPYIANTAGWMVAELGRQPWLIYGLLRTSNGTSPNVSSGSVLFTLMGFAGLYALLSILFLFLVHRQIDFGPEADEDTPVMPPATEVPVDA